MPLIIKQPGPLVPTCGAAINRKHFGDDVIQLAADLLEGLELVCGLLPLVLVQLTQDLVVQDPDAAVDGHQQHRQHLDGVVAAG